MFFNYLTINVWSLITGNIQSRHTWSEFAILEWISISLIIMYFKSMILPFLFMYNSMLLKWTSWNTPDTPGTSSRNMSKVLVRPTCTVRLHCLASVPWSVYMCAILNNVMYMYNMWIVKLSSKKLHASAEYVTNGQSVWLESSASLHSRPSVPKKAQIFCYSWTAFECLLARRPSTFIAIGMK